jgi:flagellar basal-body rod protein FlgF
MENALLIGLTRQMTLRRALDVTANNLANMSTAGFKLERPMLSAHEAGRPARAADGAPISFVRDWGFARDFAQGQVEPTQRPLDVAIEGDGFFTVQARNGETRYTRDGRFTIDAQGQLATAAGFPVLDADGRTITMPADGAPPVIDETGAILAGGATVARLGLVQFTQNAALDKAGDGTYRADTPALPADEARALQGFVERSNVNPIEEITRLIDVTRAYESVSRMLSSDEDLKRKAIDTLSGVR